ncbi:hypothetical protein OG943_31420 [Amycolatopsis sp. NBC_00345]|uniref:VC0807 family protein n=1 Tax=Amycolatopsis sp. NBC_00345 TaxID=2975955 RepID=UPI002E2566C9
MIRSTKLKAVVSVLLKDIALPGAGYYACHLAGADDRVALSVGGAVAAVLTIVEAVRNRRVEIVAAVMLGLFLFGLAATFLTGDPRILVLKDSVVTGAVAFAFIGTTLADRPLLFLIGRRFETAGDPAAVAAFEDRYATDAPTRRRFTVLSYAWGLGLLLEAAVRTVLCFTLPIDEMVALSPVLLFGSMTVIYLAAKAYLKVDMSGAPRTYNDSSFTSSSSAARFRRCSR